MVKAEYDDMENWVHAHVNRVWCFGDSAVTLVPDNLKTGSEGTVGVVST